MALKDGDIIDGGNGKAYHVKIDPNGADTYWDDHGNPVHYDLVEGFNKPNPGAPPTPSDSPPPQPGPVVNAPPVPGGADHPGQGVTAVNTDAMKTFAANLDTLVDGGSPLVNAGNDLQNVTIRPGGFRTALTLSQNAKSLMDATQNTIHLTVEAIKEIAAQVHKIALDYEHHEDANKMTSDQYSKYLGRASSIVGKIDSQDGGSSGGSGK